LLNSNHPLKNLNQNFMKTRFLTLSLFVIVLAASCKKETRTEPTPTPNNDPELMAPETNKVAHYSFNGNLNDGSGNNLNASNSNNTLSYANDRFGRVNQAAVFGASGPTWVSTPSLSSKVPGFPFSISLWFKADGVSSSQTLVRSDGGESSSYSGYWLQLAVAGAGTMSLSFGDNTGASSNSRNTITTSAAITPNAWHHVVINVRGANDMDFYINGAKNNEATYSGSASTMVYNTINTGGVIGLYPGASSSFAGLMDDYRIYTKALSPTEISTLYNFQP
jgi:Concanavalin A-like lectin/glucanases superfamily